MKMISNKQINFLALQMVFMTRNLICLIRRSKTSRTQRLMLESSQKLKKVATTHRHARMSMRQRQSLIFKSMIGQLLPSYISIFRINPHLQVCAVIQQELDKVLAENQDIKIQEPLHVEGKQCPQWKTVLSYIFIAQLIVCLVGGVIFVCSLCKK